MQRFQGLLVSQSNYRNSSMAGNQTRVVGHYQPDGFYVQIQPTQKLYFYTNEVYEEVTSLNYQTNLNRPDTYIGIFENNQMTWLPEGTRVHVETVTCPASPVQPPTWSYFNGSQWIPLGPEQTPIYWYNGECYSVNSLRDVEWAKHPMCHPGIQYSNGNTEWLIKGAYFFLKTEQSLEPDPALCQLLSTNQMQPRKCTECGAMVLTFSRIFGNVVCHECAINRLCEGRLSSMESGKDMHWSARIIAELYSQLSEITDEAMRARLPPTIPMPLDCFVCVARNKACAVGYPAEGHFAGLLAKLAEEGCPNGHAICKGCAAKLTTCPKCKSFVPYQELPFHGCPACPGDNRHHASRTRGCQLPGCIGGPWPPKARPEEAKVVEVTVKEPKVQPPVEEAKGEPSAAEELPKQRAEAKVEEQPPTV